MTTEELSALQEQLNGLDDEGFNELLKGENSASFRRFLDKRVSTAVASYQKNHPDAGKDDKADDDDKGPDPIERRAQIVMLAHEKGIDPKLALSLVFGEDDEAVIDGLAEYGESVRLQTTDRFLRENGRSPEKGVKLRLDEDLSLEQIAAMSEAEQSRLSPETVSRAIERNAEERRRRSSTRARLTSNLWGR